MRAGMTMLWGPLGEAGFMSRYVDNGVNHGVTGCDGRTAGLEGR